MPGVPSGRGCDGCRKQKKKCDQAKPSCARCTRLSIPCVGGGKQRYKFKVQVLEQQGSTALVAKETCVQVNPLALVPRNRTGTIAAVFISKLQVTDVRYDINCYGTFLQRLPERLGKSKALDASVDAFSTALTTLHSDGNELRALSKYGGALNALRDSLDDPSQSTTIDTMCAIYLIMVVQGWIGKTDPNTSTHAEGLSHLLQAASTRNWRGAFETEIIVTMCIPVIIEGMVNPRIKLQPWLGDLMDKFRIPQPFGPEPPDQEKKERDNSNVFPSLRLRNLARFPDFLQEPELHHLDILSAYHMLRFDCRKLHLRSKAPLPEDMSSGRAISAMRLNHGYRVAYAMAASLALMLNMILQGFDPLDSTLARESVSCINELLHIAEDSFCLRPLGSNYIPIGLSIAWAATDVAELRTSTMTMLLEYQLDFLTTNWVEKAHWWKAKFKEAHLRILEHEASVPPDFDWDREVEEVDLSSNECAIQ